MAKDSSNELSFDLKGGADTIVALATPPGRGALAIIRVSGQDARRVGTALCRGFDFESARCAQLVPVCNPAGDEIERAIVIPYVEPRSYTGEDMLEMVVHSSPVLVGEVVESCVGAGCRRAEPGEFTRRAVANGKLDLLQAEAIRDLIDADAMWQLRNARGQLAGRLSVRITRLRESVRRLLGLLEASLDFEAQGVAVAPEEIAGLQSGCLAEIDGLLASSRIGEKIRDGVSVAIVGPPNAGKSTLFNHLCGFEKAIVASEAGTTRDVLDADLEIGGVRVLLHDTAGLRVGGDSVEIEGRRRAVAVAERADVVLHLWATDGEKVEPSLVGVNREVLRVRSKSDLDPKGTEEDGWLAVSCATGAGMPELRDWLERTITGGIAELRGEVAIAARHRMALEVARTELAVCRSEDPELAAENVRWAARALAELMGEIDEEDVLDEVFSSFCIGK